eukprot:TRINITY_DN3341_c0_g1_i4.p2 TRINITY_DN3341_c0_g1~~TRINITY_DN3341_c0_g1_i4.p2  ORF type:complete len:173 (-),score=27.64 TRINITY_DN3341_c0_g1_i4:23-541(-)
MCIRDRYQRRVHGVLLAATMAAVFYGLYKQGFPSEETPEAPAPENEEVEPRDLQIACSSLYDLLNDVVQALRNIIVLKDPQTVVCVLGALSALALLSQFIGDYVLLWILFDLSFLLASKPVAEGQFVSAIASKLNLKEYLNIVLGMIPRYEEKEGPTSSEEMPENRAQSYFS